MTRWEYRIESGMRSEFILSPGTLDKFTAMLAALAEEGWELVQVHCHESACYSYCVFKRPRPDPSELERLGNMASTF